MDEVVRLDRKSFEALAGRTRVRVLKALLERRKTLTELSAQLKFSPSTMKEHMKVLEDAGLVVQVDEGRKWKYYELTKMGERVARPVEIRAIVMLAASLFLLGAALLNMFSAVGPAAMVQGEVQLMSAPSDGAAAGGAAGPDATDDSAEGATGGDRAGFETYSAGSPEEPMAAPMAAEEPAVEGESAWGEEEEAGVPAAYPGTEDAGAEKLAASSGELEPGNWGQETAGLPLLEIAMVLAAAVLAGLALLNARERKAL